MLERLVDMLGDHSLATGYGVVFAVLLLCGCGLPMPEDIVLVAGGVLAWLSPSAPEVFSFNGMLHDHGLIGMVVVGLFGILAGDSIVYLAGRRYGARVAEFWPLRRMVTPQKLQRVESLMRRRGNVVVLVARYLPGLRAPTFFTAGHARMGYPRFLFFDGMAALVSAPLWVCLGYYFGDDIGKLAHTTSWLERVVVLVALAAVAALLIAWRRRRRRAALAGPARPAAPGPAARPRASKRRRQRLVEHR